MDKKRFLSAKDVAEYMGISTSKAYKIIRQLNQELAEQGYVTVSGRINRTFFEEKVYAKVA